jgi:hypothetical protein
MDFRVLTHVSEFPWGTGSLSGVQEILSLSWNLKVQVACSQESTTGPYLEPDESSPLPHILVLSVTKTQVWQVTRSDHITSTVFSSYQEMLQTKLLTPTTPAFYVVYNMFVWKVIFLIQ